MTDQPDDARKRHQRGVFPPFFAPRNGTSRPDGSPAAPSGSWRRVSRLFTPPDGSRTRRTPAVPLTPFTPPLAPVEPAAAEQTPPEPAESSATSVPHAEPGAEWLRDAPPAAEVDLAEAIDEPRAAFVEPTAGLEEAAAEAEVQEDDYATAEAGALLETSVPSDANDAFTVESLETEPISLDPADAGRMDVAVEAMEAMITPREAEPSVESFSSDATYDDMYASAGYVEVTEEDVTAERQEDGAESVHDREAFVDDGAPADVDVAAYTPGAPAEEQRSEEVDPWAGVELPEPAFGSIGWPTVESAPETAATSDDADEMGAALAWSDADAAASAGIEGESSAGTGSTDVASDDALTEVAHELHDSSSPWRPDEGGASEYDDLSARARFYGGGESGISPGELDEVGEVGHAAAESEAVIEAGHVTNVAASDAPGAAIADALARVAARIRAGEVDLPSESAGVSDESALAAALAALLRGPRR